MRLPRGDEGKEMRQWRVSPKNARPVAGLVAGASGFVTGQIRDERVGRRGTKPQGCDLGQRLFEPTRVLTKGKIYEAERLVTKQIVLLSFCP